MQSTGNSSFSCGTGVGSLLNPSPPQGFNLPPVPEWCWWATGNFTAGYSCSLPNLLDVPHILVGSGRFAILPHTLCSPICFEFYAYPWRWWQTQGLCLLSARTLPCCICHNFTCGIALPSIEKGQPPCEPTSCGPSTFGLIRSRWTWLSIWGNFKGDISGKLELPTIH